MKQGHIDVEYLRHSGDDLAVVNAARVSFDNESELEMQCAVCGQPDCEEHDKHYFPGLNRDDGRLINYLAKHKHKSPFNHAFVSFRCTAPIFVARQLVKHEYLPWNEVSRRYVEGGLEWWFPDLNDWRCKVPNVKQGSGDPLPHATVIRLKAAFEDLCRQAESLYESALHSGLCPEQARAFLPQSLMTSWVWSGSVYAFAKMTALRLDSHAQREAAYVAAPINATLHSLFPVSMAALQEHGAT